MSSKRDVSKDKGCIFFLFSSTLLSLSKLTECVTETVNKNPNSLFSTVTSIRTITCRQHVVFFLLLQFDTNDCHCKVTSKNSL